MNINQMSIVSFCCLTFIQIDLANSFATQLITFITDQEEPSKIVFKKDNDEHILNQTPSAKTLYLHLVEKESIIIVNSSVLHSLTHTLTINDNPLGILPKPIINPSDFIKLKITDELFVIIPKAYITSRENYAKIAKLTPQQRGNYSVEELTVGMQLCGTEVPDNQFLKYSYYKSKENYPKRRIQQSPIVWQEIEDGEPYTHTITRDRSGSWISKQIIENLDKIFIPLATYKKLKIQNYYPKSVIIAVGHGSKFVTIDKEIQQLKKQFGDRAQDNIKKLRKLKQKGVSAILGGQVAGFESLEFGDFVSYLVKKISPSLLFFNTCYGSEVNIEAALQALAEKEKKELKDLHIPYIIISGGISNAPAYSASLLSPPIVTTVTKNNQAIHITKKILEHPRYRDFILKLNEKKTISDEVLVEALKSIYLLYGDVSSRNNVPIVKYPQENWRPLRLPDKVIIIDDAFLIRHKNHVKIDISTLFEKQKEPYPRVLLLAVPVIPFELVISGNNPTNLPNFIAYKPEGSALYSIKKITAPLYLMSDIIESFFGIEKLADDKVFLIDTITAYNDLPQLKAHSDKTTTISHIILISKAAEKQHQNSHQIIKFRNNNQDWQAIMTHQPLSDALQKDTSGTLQEEFDTLNTLINKNRSEMESKNEKN